MAFQECLVDGILFDMDGTLVDSTPAVDLAFANLYRAAGVPLTRFPHGVRSEETVARLFPGKSSTEVAELVFAFEKDIVDNARALEAAGKTGLIILPSVPRILEEIRSNPQCEKHYAICTSATRVYATAALETAGIRPPSHFLTAEMVSNGKPHPEPYLKGAAMLGLNPQACLSVEDAPSGIRSGLAAGTTVLAVCTSHTREELKDLGAHYLVDNLDAVKLEWVGNKIRVVVEQ